MKKYFLTGLATLLPLAVTIYLVIFAVHFLTRPFIGVVIQLVHKLPIPSFGLISSEQLIFVLSEILILAALFIFLFLLGMVARWFFFNALIKLGDKILHKIPLVNKIYKTARDVTQTLFNSGKNSFKQVVLLQFPHKGCYCLGLVTSDSPDTCSQQVHNEMISIFIPTTPNPMSGFLLMSPKSDLIYLKMKSEEAIKYVVSCGVIQPGQRDEL
jgi:uncharacterized membrane protein